MYGRVLLQVRCAPRGGSNLRALHACLAFALLTGATGCGTSGNSTTGWNGDSIASADQGKSAATAAVLGYVWDSRVPALRLVAGIPGAARLQSGTVGDVKLTAAVPCTLKGFALTQASSGAILTMSLPGGQTSKLAAPIAKNQKFLLSPSCSNAFVYAPGASKGLLIGGLPASPQIRLLNLPASDSLVGVAVSDTGSVLLADRTSDGSATVQLLKPAGGTSQTVKVMQKYGAMAFIPGGDAAVFADSGTNIVTFTNSLVSGSGFTQLAIGAEGVSAPVAIAASADAHYVFIVNAVGSPMLRLDLSATSAPAKIVCACNPSALLPLAGNAIFQLTDPAAGTIFALQGDAQTPRTVFIPTDTLAPAGGSR
jgi:hypothetical protein